MFRAGLYARVSTNDQQTLPMQSRAMREYAARRGWTIAMQIREVGSGAAQREVREKLLEAARRREIDVVLVWRLDRWGRSVTDLLATLQELEHLGVGFVSLTEALDLTTPAGRAMAGLLAVFAEFERDILRERVRAGLAHARQNGKRLGRPATAAVHAAEVRKLYRAGVSKSEIARRLQIGRTSVRRVLATGRGSNGPTVRGGPVTHRKRIAVGEKIPLELTEHERDLIMKHTFAGNNLTDRLRVVPSPGQRPFYRFTLDDLDELAGYVAAEANHAKVKKLEKELRQLYSRIADVLESHTDEPAESAH
jgi:DNA invertase Pin-like site-specific DNA recombinase